MSSFIFNGFSSKELGLIITKPVFRPSWAEEVDEITIPGKTQKLRIHTGVYGSQSFTIETAIPEATPENVRRIYQALCGSGRLVLSSNPSEYLNVDVEPLVPQAIALCMAELPISFTALPFAYAIEPTTVTIGKEYTPVPNNGTIFSEPVITFTPTGVTTVIYVNGEKFTVTSDVPNAEYTIDCENKIAYYTQKGINTVITHKTEGDFPRLHIGDNYVKYEGNVSDIKICVNNRYR